MWPIWAELMPNLWLWIKVMLTVIKQFQSTVVSRCFRLLLDVSVTTSDAVCCYLNVYITTSGVVCCCSTSSSQRQMPFAIAWTSTSQRQVSLAAARTSTSQRQSPFVAAQRLRRDDVRCRFHSGQITIVCVMVLMDVKRLYNRYQLTFFGQPLDWLLHTHMMQSSRGIGILQCLHVSMGWTQCFSLTDYSYLPNKTYLIELITSCFHIITVVHP